MAGDFTVTVNPEQTRGREVIYVVEAKTGPLRAAKARRELDTAMKNRGAAAGVLAFDGLEDAPLGGRSFLPHGDGRFTAVFIRDDGLHSRSRSLAARHVWPRSRASAPTASSTRAGCSTPLRDRRGDEQDSTGRQHRERGAGEIRERYTQMRREALTLIDGMRRRAEQ